jgi:acetyltransferase-like isoleucine patch superfamily enzyme
MIRFIRQKLSGLKRYLRGSTGPFMIGGYKNLATNTFHPKTRISSSTFIDSPETLDVANNVYIGHYCFLEASHGIKIETGCQLTNFITITTHSSHDAIRLYGPNYKGGSEMIGYLAGAVEIGAYTFVGPYVTIMPNTKIGKGCVISAYSYVAGEIPDFSIVQGNPAKVIGDSRERDKPYLDKHPELIESYKSWTEKSE